MKSRLRCVRYSLAALFSVAALIGGAQATPIAEVTNLVNAAFRSPPGAAEMPVKISDELVQDETVRTEAESTVELNFIDGSQMSLEPESELVLSKYVFDPEGKATAAVIDLQSGLFHYTSNGAPDQDIVLKTPVATIGIRGTELVIYIGPSAIDPSVVSLRVDVIDGAIDVQPRGEGKGGSATGGQSVSVEGPNADASVGDIGDVATAAGSAATSSTSSSGSSEDHDKDHDAEPKGGGGGAGDGGPQGDPR